MKSKLKRRHLRQLTTLFNSKEDCEHNFKAALQAISHLVICLVYSKKHSKTNLFSRLSNVFLFCVIWKELLDYIACKKSLNVPHKILIKIK